MPLGVLDGRERLGLGFKHGLRASDDVSRVGGRQVRRHQDQSGRARQLSMPPRQDRQEEAQPENGRGLTQAVKDCLVTGVSFERTKHGRAAQSVKNASIASRLKATPTSAAKVRPKAHRKRRWFPGLALTRLGPIPNRPGRPVPGR